MTTTEGGYQSNAIYFQGFFWRLGMTMSQAQIMIRYPLVMERGNGKCVFFFLNCGGS